MASQIDGRVCERSQIARYGDSVILRTQFERYAGDQLANGIELQRLTREVGLGDGACARNDNIGDIATPESSHEKPELFVVCLDVIDAKDEVGPRPFAIVEQRNFFIEGNFEDIGAIQHLCDVIVAAYDG